MAEPDVIPLPERLPDVVRLTQTTGVRFTPNELRRLKEETGRTMAELMGPDADDADRMQALVWLRLTREGRSVRWEDCGDIAIDIEVEPPDPTSGGPSTSSPPSAASGA